VEEPLGERVDALVREAEDEDRVERVALLRCAPPVAAVYDRDAVPAVGRGLRARLVLAEVVRPQPQVEDAVA
jgi:hypothetical protein